MQSGTLPGFSAPFTSLALYTSNFRKVGCNVCVNGMIIPKMLFSVPQLRSALLRPLFHSIPIS